MTDKANGSGGPSHITRMRSKETSSDTLQDPKRSGSHQAEPDKRLGKIEHAGQQSAPEDRRQTDPWRKCSCFRVRKRRLNYPSTNFGSASRAKQPQLLFRNSRFFQQERLHIGDDEARVERTRTLDISHPPFPIDQKHSKGDRNPTF